MCNSTTIEEDESEDQSAFTAPGDDSNMEMTVAVGRIVDTPGDSSEMDMTIASPAVARVQPFAAPAAAAAAAASPRPAPAAPQSPRRGHEHCHKPAADTPTKRRVPPSASSSPAAKRQAFAPIAPSPRRAAAPYSPMRATAPLRMSANDTASPAFPHSPARRITVPRPEGMQFPSSPVKAARVPSPVKPTSRAGSPEKQASPVRAPRMLGGVARRSLALRPASSASVEASETSLESFRSAETGASSSDVPQVSLTEFFANLGVTFHEDITTATAHRRRVQYEERDEARPSVEMMRQAKAAAAAVPMLNSLVEACGELEHHIRTKRETLRCLDEEFNHCSPPFVRDALMCDAAAMAETQARCKSQKSAARARAFDCYYAWRLDNQFGKANTLLLQVNKAKLINDVKVVREEGAVLKQQVLPVLRERQAELALELKKERQRREQIAQCDPEVMEDLHKGIDEQGQIVDGFRARNTNLEHELARLDAKLAEVNAKRATETAAIEAARAVYEQIKGCTKTEAARLKRE